MQERSREGRQNQLQLLFPWLQVASQAVGSMPILLLFPLLPFIFVVGLVIYWVAVTAVLYSAGDLTYNFRPADEYEPMGFADFSLGANNPPEQERMFMPTDWGNYTDIMK